jgi:hypothetical protein
MKEIAHSSHIWFRILPGNHRSTANNVIILVKHAMDLAKISALHVV